MFCAEEPKVVSFDEQTALTRDEYCSQFPEYYTLCELLAGDAEIDFAGFSRIPGITSEKLAALHAKHKAGRSPKV
jgi:hypothetical protein